MASPPADLREASKTACERKRYRKHKAKWSNGVRPLYGETEIREDGHCRPGEDLRFLIEKRGGICYFPDRDEHAYKLELATKAYVRAEIDEALQQRRGRQADDDDAHDGPIDPDTPEEAFDPFDEPCIPSSGEHVLSVALDCALDRFELRQTEKLVREYGFIDESEANDAREYTADEDGYEFISRGET